MRPLQKTWAVETYGREMVACGYIDLLATEVANYHTWLPIAVSAGDSEIARLC